MTKFVNLYSLGSNWWEMCTSLGRVKTKKACNHGIGKQVEEQSKDTMLFSQYYDWDRLGFQRSLLSFAAYKSGQPFSQRIGNGCKRWVTYTCTREQASFHTHARTHARTHLPTHSSVPTHAGAHACGHTFEFYKKYRWNRKTSIGHTQWWQSLFHYITMNTLSYLHWLL